MDMRRGVLLPEQQDFQMPGPWIPGTPANPVLVKRQHAAAASGLGNHTARANWLESVVGLPPGFVCSSRAAQEGGACQSGSSGSAGVANRVLDLNGCEVAVASQSVVSGCNVFPQTPAMRGSTQGWYSDLLAMVGNGDAPRNIEASLPAFSFENTGNEHEQCSAPLLLNGKVMLSMEFLNAKLRRRQPGPGGGTLHLPPQAVAGLQEGVEGRRQAGRLPHLRDVPLRRRHPLPGGPRRRRQVRPQPPRPLAAFLADERNKFVGIGIEKAAERLERAYSVHVANATELRPLVAGAFGRQAVPPFKGGRGDADGLRRMAMVALKGVDAGKKPATIEFDDWRLMDSTTGDGRGNAGESESSLGGKRCLPCARWSAAR